jgi:RNA polymerase sigma factor (sigma-70 family)
MAHSLPKSEPDQAVIEALNKEHGTALIRYFQRRGIAIEQAEDAAQEVFFRLAKRGSLSAIERLDGYLFQTAANVAADVYRKAKSDRTSAHVAYDEALHAPQDHSPEEHLEGREGLRLVIQGLKELPERTRTIFLLARLENITQPEIAKRLGVSLATVERDLMRAVTHLAQKVGRRP